MIEATTGKRVLIASVSIGQGHDGAAKELSRRFHEQGYETFVVDFLDFLPFGLGKIIKTSYGFQLRKFPWAYDFIYKTFRSKFLHKILTKLLVAMTGDKTKELVDSYDPIEVVSTYPFSSLVFGEGRRKGWLKVPASTFVTDFTVHPLWMHPFVDLTFCVSQDSADYAQTKTDKQVVATGPIVDPNFLAAYTEKYKARKILNLPFDAQIVLITAGSWGVGAIEDVFDRFLESESFFPIAICGSNNNLKLSLEARGGGRAVGWTDEMALYMSASDVLLQNAGGLTCMEAFAVGLPVVTYKPIAGHGYYNALNMDQAGVAPFIQNSSNLLKELEFFLLEGAKQAVTQAEELFQSDPIEHAIKLIDTAKTDIKETIDFVLEETLEINHNKSVTMIEQDSEAVA